MSVGGTPLAIPAPVPQPLTFLMTIPFIKKSLLWAPEVLEKKFYFQKVFPNFFHIRYIGYETKMFCFLSLSNFLSFTLFFLKFLCFLNFLKKNYLQGCTWGGHLCFSVAKTTLELQMSVRYLVSLSVISECLLPL